MTGCGEGFSLGGHPRSTRDSRAESFAGRSHLPEAEARRSRGIPRRSRAAALARSLL